MPYIHEDTKEYPLTVSQIRRRHLNVSFPRTPSDEILADFGYKPVQPTDKPSGEVVTETDPTQQADGTWVQAWKTRQLTSEERAQRLADHKQSKAEEIMQSRNQEFEAGITYTFSDGDDVVQTRAQDQINLLALSTKAQRKIDANDTSTIPFRGKSNITHNLTPDEMNTMTMAALQHIEDIYQKSWDLKDQIDNATTLTQVKAISWS